MGDMPTQTIYRAVGSLMYIGNFDKQHNLEIGYSCTHKKSNKEIYVYHIKDKKCIVDAVAMTTLSRTPIVSGLVQHFCKE